METNFRDISRYRRTTLHRSNTDHIIAGVCGGLAEQIGVSPTIVRISFALMTLAGGIGVAFYGIAFLISSSDSTEVLKRPASLRHNAGFVFIIVAIMLIIRQSGLWFGDRRMWPLGLAILGSIVIFLRDDSEKQITGDSLIDALGSRPSRLRLLAGAALVLTGLATFLAVNNAIHQLRNAAIAVLASAAGVVLIFGPWLTRLGRQLLDERRERVRSEERAELGAHLHDSVLHTLALIQRSNSSSEMVALARRQERDLRAWLHGRSLTDEEGLTASIDGIASRVEQAHGVTVDSVVVGDCEVDEHVRAILAATQEAAMNAALHSGVKKISIYVEAERDSISAFIRDNGKGFDRNDISADRRGISESIEGRMKRNGGVAHINSQLGVGTNVELQIPLRTNQTSKAADHE